MPYPARSLMMQKATTVDRTWLWAYGSRKRETVGFNLAEEQGTGRSSGDDGATVNLDIATSVLGVFLGISAASLVVAAQLWKMPFPREAFLATTYHAFLASLAVGIVIVPLTMLRTLVKTKSGARAIELATISIVGPICLLFITKIYLELKPLERCVWGNPPECTAEE